MSTLAPINQEIVDLIKSHTTKLVEFGAGDGEWARTLRAAGVDVFATDPRPRGPGVVSTDYRDAKSQAADLLVVWPPDGYTLRHWLVCKVWRKVIVCTSFGRLPGEWPVWFRRRQLLAELSTPDGVKGRNLLRIWQ